MQKTDTRRSFSPCRCGIGSLDCSGARIFSCMRCLCGISDKEEDKEPPYVHSSIGRSQFPLPPCAWNRVLFIIDHAVSAKAGSPLIVFLFVPCLEYMELPFPSEPDDFCALLQPPLEIHVTVPKALCRKNYDHTPVEMCLIMRSLDSYIYIEFFCNKVDPRCQNPNSWRALMLTSTIR